jgi:hypothetical protein
MTALPTSHSNRIVGQDFRRFQIGIETGKT